MQFKFSHSGFTLVEIMIVITLVVILMGIALFPYDYYMDRSRVEKNIDMVAQEWILAHNDIKNGLLYDASSHAHLYLHFPLWSNTLDLYTSSGDLSRDKPYKTLKFDRNIQIQAFSGIELGWSSEVVYHIQPPYGHGAFSTGWTEVVLTGVTLILGYPGASLESGRARRILLRPYY